MKKTLLPELKLLDRGRVAEQILVDLRQRILSGALPRGAKLPAERELAVAYGVSGATVREALRALATTHMIDIRHGSGAYVTADAEQLIAQSLQSMIQLERVDAHDVLGVLTVLNVHSAELAASRATPEELDGLRAALDRLDAAETAQELESCLQAFLLGLATASHNALLVAISKFLISLQMGIAKQIAAGSAQTWKRTVGRLAKDRRDLVEAIAAGDAAAAGTLARAYHRRAFQAIDAAAN
jgi:GntR family transcriptional regulator, transcriptional repressor for pyruvate dehydrogenase complex